MIEPSQGETGFAGAEGATAPETLRQKNLDGDDFWKVAFSTPADGIMLSGANTEGAQQPDFPAKGAYDLLACFT